MLKRRIYFADLTHTQRGIHASAFPLGTSFVCSYAKKILGEDFEIELFKFYNKLTQRIIESPPLILAFSNYSWNLELGHELSKWAKKINPNLIVIFGGPNFPINNLERVQFLKKYNNIDFYIELEGEFGFVELIKKLEEHNFNVLKLKKKKEAIPNCSYLIGNCLISGPIQRIKDLNVIPSPYLSGVMDKFFELPLVPMIETTRGCPFSCIYCADSLLNKCKITRFDDKRIRDELNYIGKKIKNIDELTITDLNFGMYKEDIVIAKHISEVQKKYKWPVLIKATAGKNNPDITLKAVALLSGSWQIGAAIQSSDETVLKNIKRNNISLEVYQKFIDFNNKASKDAQTYTEVILALPGDTKEKHFESLRYAMNSNVNCVRMYQAILLTGTEMAKKETRSKYGLMTKFRVIPGGVGIYQFGDEKIPVAEIEEIVIGSKDMTFDDYVSCRVMDLLVETYFNNGPFEYFFAVLKKLNISAFDCLIYIFEHKELQTPKMEKIIENFIRNTTQDLFGSYEEAKEHVLHPDIIKKYISGEWGINEILVHQSELYLEFDDIISVLVKTIKNILKEKNLFNENANNYFEELKEFVICKNKDFFKYEKEILKSFNYDFKEIEKLNFEIDPLCIEQAPHPIKFKFFHDKAQIEHIKHALNLYKNTPSGIGRLIQRSILKKMFRNFIKV